ncbi:NADH-quinone oxidoreductase subunit J [Pseudoxanthomonas winnipegensis]|uniref:NADH-quinone oxidoreductase subunit J n=1 Tax=Pseudoxanthomonas winnipegensis TaxID=2480810 RepID=A0A4Q8L7H6_9GAMM|nr:NADH-quinone oxidoreductase subunit J [Pseudoxanthomonas winnipegensis]RZZ81103.1 NADH-quinone oxidoreductase subunit J [Pseudoxanthomonas winnipegensis]TAA24048.1 NADH-quinone oxidoreductase subunit J [Pseudoxanthomonas winnipegensis]TAA42013.1 NADH-quinone oxidoreductase subunit J [Pseudoxanthomonas winnipegensis]TBV71479.1 NADH-quinone oxidoreductase subunit J [Pseudoxanthomonas winnipegensis]
MDWINISFWIFAAVAAVSGAAVISVRNPVHAVLFLILTFFSVACVWLLVGAEFLGVALILVYVGAVMVLFLFVVMMLDIDVAQLRQGWVRFLPVGLLVAVVMLVQMLVLIGVKAKAGAALPDNAAAAAAETSNITWLARSLFTEFLLPFEFAAVILTVAVIAAVMLTLRKREGVKTQDPSEQTRVKARDRFRMVRMEPVRPAAPVVETPAQDGAQEAKS